MKYKFALTKTSGKIRIKERLTFGDYGISIAPTKTKITHKHYAEWQIGYDKVVGKNDKFDFIGANGKPKVLYELSEFLKFGFDSKLIKDSDIQKVLNFISSNNEFINSQNITRTNFVTHKIAGIDFLKSSVSYPLFIYKFEINDAICEVIVREKQYASGIMPMLYFCLPLHSIDSKILGRVIKSGECATLQINQSNIFMFLKMFEIFGVLSQAHKHDCIEILKVILSSQNL